LTIDDDDDDDDNHDDCFSVVCRKAIRSEDTAFVVEGYFDVIKLHDAGIRCAVGVLGTAITIDQLQLCARYVR